MLAISAFANILMGLCLKAFIIIGISMYEMWLNTNITAWLALGALKIHFQFKYNMYNHQHIFSSAQTDYPPI